MQRTWRRHLLLVVMSLAMPFASGAATLKIHITGTGYGSVFGPNMLCPDLCERDFEHPVSVHVQSITPEQYASVDFDQFQNPPEPAQAPLLAVPYDDAKFIEWRIHDTVLSTPFLLEDDTTITAVFERIAEIPNDELRLSWYEGNILQEGVVALDEIQFFPSHEKSWYEARPTELEKLLQTVRQHFHPQAQLVEHAYQAIRLKSPDPLTTSEWLAAYRALLDMPMIDFVIVNLYFWYPDRSQSTYPTGSIAISYPPDLTLEEIEQLEREYELENRDTIMLTQHTIYFYWTKDALKAIDIANRVRESGRVESVTVEMHREMLPLE